MKSVIKWPEFYPMQTSIFHYIIGLMQANVNREVESWSYVEMFWQDIK